MNFLRTKKTDAPTRAEYRSQISGHQQRLISTKLQPRKSDAARGRPDSSSRTKKIILVVILIAGLSAYNIWLIIRCFYVAPANHVNIKQIVTPLSNSPFEGKWFDGEIDQVAHRKITAFKNHMDSLSHSKEGRAEYDRIMALRPGLMDSLLLYERTIGLPGVMPVSPQ